MTFYVKRSGDAKVEGPFTIREINQMLWEKRFTVESLAIADNGQGLQAAGRTPMNEWIKVVDIAGYDPAPEGEQKYTLLMIIILALMVLIPVAVLIWVAIMLNRIH